MTSTDDRGQRSAQWLFEQLLEPRARLFPGAEGSSCPIFPGARCNSAGA